MPAHTPPSKPPCPAARILPAHAGARRARPVSRRRTVPPAVKTHIIHFFNLLQVWLKPIPQALPRLLAVLLLVAAGPSAARTIAVPDDAATIGGAMEIARAGDIILVSCGTYLEHDIVVRSGVSIWSGTLQPDCVVIDAGGRGRVLVFENCDPSTSVVGVTLRGGRSDGDGGAVLCRDASPRFSRCVVQDSSARRGGGLHVSGRGAPVLEDCEFSGNTALLHGGAIAWDTDARGRLEGGRIEGNRALAGGGLAVLNGADLVLEGVRLLGNDAGASGGGVWVGGGSPELRSCLLAGNHGGLAGGALACHGGAPRLVACTVADNGAETAGGGVLVRDASPRIERTIVAFNRDSAVAVVGAGRPRLIQSNIFGHPVGDWTGLLGEQADGDGNFSRDPLFCAPSRGRYDLRAASPCLPRARAGGGDLVGAFARGCD